MAISAGVDRAGGSSRVQSVDRAAVLLGALADAGPAGAGASELAARCRLNRATAWRILSTMAQHHLVRRDRGDGRWFLDTGITALAQRGGLDMAAPSVRDVLADLARRTGETAAIAALTNGSLAYVEEVLPPSVVAVTWSKREVSLHATSTGKVLLAWLSPQERAALLPLRLSRFTATTITRRADLNAELSRIRLRGYAYCRGEFDRSAWGVSVPVLDEAGQLISVVSVWGPPPRVNDDAFAELARLAELAAARIAAL